MKRRQFISAIPAFAGQPLWSPILSAQASTRMTVIGLLDAGERREWWDALRQRLRGLGYVEGRNVSFESRYAKGKMDALNALADELARLEVAVIVTSSSAAAVAAARATRKIPIVIASGGDQVGRGLASSLTRPKGNVTGVTSLSSDLMAKRLEQLREVAPKSTRLAALWHADNSSTASVRELDLAASRARLAFQSVGFKDAAELTETFAAMARDRIDALVVIQSALVHAERKRIAALADKHKLPAIYGSAEFADAGGLLAYGPSYPDMFRRAAHYVDKILKGAIPGELPIEQPTTFELVINASAARRLGVDVPPQLLARASRVIQ